MAEIRSFSLPYEKTNSFSKTLLAYLDRDPTLRDFIQEWPDLEAFKEQIERKSGFAHREVLVESLHTQYHKIQDFENAVSASVLDNIRLLGDSQTYTVTTGHQLNVFTGPLYFLFKIAATIRLARDLKVAYPGYHFVPVYWMASEDHDFEEINHTFVHNTRISWEKGVTSATGRVKTTDIREVVKRYQNILGLDGYAVDLAKLAETAYLGHMNLADATRSFVNSLFGEEGLIIMDADDLSLKRVFSPIISRDIFEQNSFHCVDKTNKELISRGFGTQVFAREINFFYLVDAYRERILPAQNGGFEINNQNLRFTKEELEEQIASDPALFSPNVIMRPVYQEYILPNLAYIGGGAEVVYWLQLKAVFDFYKIPFPLLIPRNSAAFISQRNFRQWQKLGFEISDLFENEEALNKQFVLRNTEHSLDLLTEKELLNQIFLSMKDRVSEIDETLRASAEAVQKRLDHALNNLEKKLIKAEKRNHQDALRIISRIKSELFPGGSLQERKENFAQFYVLFGPKLIEKLIQTLNPLDFTFTVLEVEPKN